MYGWALSRLTNERHEKARVAIFSATARSPRECCTKSWPRLGRPQFAFVLLAATAATDLATCERCIEMHMVPRYWQRLQAAPAYFAAIASNNRRSDSGTKAAALRKSVEAMSRPLGDFAKSSAMLMAAKMVRVRLPSPSAEEQACTSASVAVFLPMAFKKEMASSMKTPAEDKMSGNEARKGFSSSWRRASVEL